VTLPPPGSGGTVRSVCTLAEASPGREVCGFVLEGPGGLEVVSAPNVADDPARGFRIAPEAVLSVLRRADEPGRKVAALFHSHPAGGAALSARDLAELVVDGSPALPGAQLWVIALESGKAVELRAFGWQGGRFEEVARLRGPFTG
jgi:proteasome lid subunit RPN8/RPN11